jgi:hypothetical protein
VFIQGELGGFLLIAHVVNKASTLFIVVVLDVAKQSSFYKENGLIFRSLPMDILYLEAKSQGRSLYLPLCEGNS